MTEILAPVGNMEMLAAAINAGADSVYVGVKGFNMRAGARNFELSQLKTIAEKCHKNNVRAYLALNIIIYQDEVEKARTVLKAAKEANIDAVDPPIRPPTTTTSYFIYYPLLIAPKGHTTMQKSHFSHPSWAVIFISDSSRIFCGHTATHAPQ